MKNLFRNLAIVFFCFCTLGLFAQEEKTSSENNTNREMTVKLPRTGNNLSTITVTEINNQFIYQGDIIVERQGRGGATATDDSFKWPNSMMPYVIASGHPKTAEILAAISTLNSSTNLCILPREGESDYVEFIYQAGRCGASRIGKNPSGGRQRIIVGNLCGNTTGSTMHEIMHALGFYHEQSRDDRDTYITVNTSNIKAGHEHNFDKYNEGIWHILFPEGENIGAYDYGSIMHYGNKAFGKPNASGTGRLTTITPKNISVVIGQRNNLSAGDINSINTLYPTVCNGSTSEVIEVVSEQPNQSMNLSYAVNLLPQSTRVSCWAAAAAMIVGWRDNMSMDEQAIAQGTRGWNAYFHNSGLPSDNVEMFHYWGLQYEEPQSYTPRGFANLLANGPIWAATDLNNDPHVIVISGISGDGSPEGTILTVFDPLEQGMTSFRSSNTGSTYEVTYKEFQENQNRLASRELNEPIAYYIAY